MAVFVFKSQFPRSAAVTFFVNETITISLYRGIFKTLKNWIGIRNHKRKARESRNEICLYVRYRGTTAILSISPIFIRDIVQLKYTYCVLSIVR